MSFQPEGAGSAHRRRLGASPVQLSIMRLMLVEELSNESIAHRLGRTRMAVDTQIKRLYKKVGVKTRVGLVKRVYGEAYAIQHNIRPDE